MNNMSEIYNGNMVEHPSHYNREGSLECIWEMVLLYGIQDTMTFCKLNAHKYRSRAMDKGGKEDMKKSDFYIKFYAYLNSTPKLEVYEYINKLYNGFDDVKQSMRLK